MAWNKAISSVWYSWWFNPLSTEEIVNGTKSFMAGLSQMVDLAEGGVAGSFM